MAMKTTTTMMMMVFYVRGKRELVFFFFFGRGWWVLMVLFLSLTSCRRCVLLSPHRFSFPPHFLYLLCPPVVELAGCSGFPEAGSE